MRGTGTGARRDGDTRHRAAVAMLGLAALFAPAAAQAQPVRTDQVDLGGSYNELGLQVGGERAWRWRIGRSDHPLLSRAHVSVGVSPRLTPSHGRLEAWARIAPLSVLELQAGVEPAWYFGTFGSLLGFADYTADYSSEARRERRDESAAGAGARAYAGATLQAEVGRIAVRTRLTSEWWKLDAGDDYVYEPARKTLLRADGDALLQLSSVVLVRVSESLRLGVAHELTRVPDAPFNDVQQLSAVTVWEPDGRCLGAHTPAVFAGVRLYLDHPSREGSVGATLGFRWSVGR